VIYDEIFWVNLPDRPGREQGGRRPAIIWQDTVTFPLPTVLIIPLSTQMNALRFPATLEIRPSAASGLASPFRRAGVPVACL
jgi:mRNA-degrading endonuclease toxin of MazEF toxin-antitoxin module